MEQTQVLQVFSFRGNDLRVKVIDGEFWFAVVDACKVLEIVNVAHTIARLDPDGVRQTYLIDALGREQNTALANEPNLYRIIFRSDKPEAKAFQDWVYNEVLPTIRKTGSYGSPLQGDIWELLRIPDNHEFNRIIARMRRLRRIEYPAIPQASRAKRIATPLEPVDIERLILEKVKHITEVDKPPTVRDLSRYFPSIHTEDIRRGVTSLVRAGLLTFSVSPHGTRYSLL